MKRRKSVHRNDLQTETDITGAHPTICHKLLTVLNLLCGTLEGAKVRREKSELQVTVYEFVVSGRTEESTKI